MPTTLQDLIDKASEVLLEYLESLLRPLTQGMMVMADELMPDFVPPVIGKANKDIVEADLDALNVTELHTLADQEKVEAIRLQNPPM